MINFQFNKLNPVVIGGVGGSGTRLITQCLQKAGYYMGSELNESLDNIWFTLLFKRFDVLSTRPLEFDELLRTFLIGMIDNSQFTEQHINLFKSLAKFDRNLHPAVWLNQIANAMQINKPKIKPGDLWGWKEPNSHIILDRLIKRFDQFKYIHVVRNGLDMAHSINQNQLIQWGSYFIDEPFEISPYYSLKYWSIVHKRVIKLGQDMPNNFLFLSYDDFCMNPHVHIKKLCDFLEIEQKELCEQLIGLVLPPRSIGRYKQHGIEIFDPKDVEYVQSLGFCVD